MSTVSPMTSIVIDVQAVTPKPGRYAPGPQSRLLSRWVVIGRRGYAAYRRTSVHA